MTNIQARKLAREDIRKALRAAGLLDGISLQASQLHNESHPCFWRGAIRDPVARSKDQYVTWHIPSSDTAERADDKTFLREITIAVDVFSKRSFESEANHKLLERLETAFDNAGYEVEFADEIYENDTKLFHYPLTLYKLYGGKINE